MGAEGVVVGITSLVEGKKFFLVGIKGTGMTSLATLLVQYGACVSGSDVPEVFSTDSTLSDFNISWVHSFDEAFLPEDVSIVIHSAAFSREQNPQLIHAKKRNIPIYSYPEWLAYMSTVMKSFGVAGTHGKTSTCGCTEWVLRNTGLHYFAMYGAHLMGNWGIKPALSDPCGIFEACEYRDHFLSYDLDGLLITAIEHDHPDWFTSHEQLYTSFLSAALKLPQGAPLICGVDSELSRRLFTAVSEQRSDLLLISYGEHPSSMVRLVNYTPVIREASYMISTLEGYFHSSLGSLPLILNTIGASLLASCMISSCAETLSKRAFELVHGSLFTALLRESEHYPGVSGRLEELSIFGEITYVSDYAHHPTEIRVALEALRERYPDRRIVTIFYPHTVSRTVAYFDQFAEVLQSSDELIVRSVFASARHDGAGEEARALGKQLAQQAHGRFAETHEDVVEACATILRPGDVCVTMGAGNSNGLAQRIAKNLRSN